MLKGFVICIPLIITLLIVLIGDGYVDVPRPAWWLSADAEPRARPTEQTKARNPPRLQELRDQIAQWKIERDEAETRSHDATSQLAALQDKLNALSAGAAADRTRAEEAGRQLEKARIAARQAEERRQAAEMTLAAREGDLQREKANTAELTLKIERLRSEGQALQAENATIKADVDQLVSERLELISLEQIDRSHGQLPRFVIHGADLGLFLADADPIFTRPEEQTATVMPRKHGEAAQQTTATSSLRGALADKAGGVPLPPQRPTFRRGQLAAAPVETSPPPQHRLSPKQSQSASTARPILNSQPSFREEATVSVHEQVGEASPHRVVQPEENARQLTWGTARQREDENGRTSSWEFISGPK